MKRQADFHKKNFPKNNEIECGSYTAPLSQTSSFISTTLIINNTTLCQHLDSEWLKPLSRKRRCQ